MKTKHFKLLFILLFCSGIASGQQHFAFGLKARADVGMHNNTNFILSASAGYGKEINYTLHNSNGSGIGALLSFQFGINLYRGGLGNSKLPSRIDDHQLDFYNCFAVTPGYWYRKGNEHLDYQRPLYTWTANYANNLINPYQWSTTLATNFLWNVPINSDGFISGKNKKATNSIMSPVPEISTQKIHQNRSQRIGFLGFALDKFVSLGYANDGPPFEQMFGLGDGFDRYWTGSGFVHLGATNWLPTKGADNKLMKSVPQFIFSFDKFTGYSPNSYEVSNLLKLLFVPYKQEEMSSYNRSMLRYTLLFNDGTALAISTFDDRTDIQDLIHEGFNYPHHPNIYKRYNAIGLQQLITNQYLIK